MLLEHLYFLTGYCGGNAIVYYLQCFDAIGWATGRASDL